MDMTVKEFLDFCVELKKVPKKDRADQVAYVMAMTGIEEMSERLIKNLSKGYKQRVGIAQAILGNPEIIILDEPTVGLDPNQLVEVRNLIRSLKEDHAVILSSHIMGEITAVCDYVIMIANGRIVKQGTLEELEGSTNSNTVTIESRGSAALIESAVNALDGVKYSRFTETGTTVKAVIETKKCSDIREELFYLYADLKAPILEMKTSSVNLEDLFIKLTREADKADAKEERPRREKKIFTPSPLGQAYIEENSEIPEAEPETDEEEYVSMFGEEENEDEGGEE